MIFLILIGIMVILILIISKCSGSLKKEKNKWEPYVNTYKKKYNEYIKDLNPTHKFISDDYGEAIIINEKVNQISFVFNSNPIDLHYVKEIQLIIEKVNGDPKIDIHTYGFKDVLKSEIIEDGKTIMTIQGVAKSGVSF